MTCATWTLTGLSIHALDLRPRTIEIQDASVRVRARPGRHGVAEAETRKRAMEDRPAVGSLLASDAGPGQQQAEARPTIGRSSSSASS